MLVCLCTGVSDRKIRRLVREGAASPREVARACGAGASCGGCRPAVQALIEQTRSELDAGGHTSPSLFSAEPIAPSLA